MTAHATIARMFTWVCLVMLISSITATALAYLDGNETLLPDFILISVVLMVVTGLCFYEYRCAAAR